MKSLKIKDESYRVRGANTHIFHFEIYILHFQHLALVRCAGTTLASDKDFAVSFLYYYWIHPARLAAAGVLSLSGKHVSARTSRLAVAGC